jgi:hypothetical protein
MSFEPSFPRRISEYRFDGEDRLLEVREFTNGGESISNEFIGDAGPAPPSFTFEGDEDEQLFVLTWSDDGTERFRDEIAPNPVVAPDPETGEMRPVLRLGRQIYLFLFRRRGEREP